MINKNIVTKIKNNISILLEITALLLLALLILSARKNLTETELWFKDISIRLDVMSKSQFKDWQDRHPKVGSNQDFQGEKSNFTPSPNKKQISFIQNVFEEYGNDWDKYWALKIFSPDTREEKTLVVDDIKMSSYQWLDDKTLRVFHNAGTGIRVYLNVSVDRSEPLFSKDYSGAEIWTIDDEYIQKAKDTQAATRRYFELNEAVLQR